ncbi:YggS family pyridoxal phosphate-dependent enzyme [Rhodococcus yananensis]|uniref:YggS family pyridoxal phosphate-dependent enzyme n=1 Tax=Rhodococcus yananensis TaxID=2879464 RepID=UPI003EB71E66
MTEADPDRSARRTEISGRLNSVRARLDAAARDAGRDPAEISLLPVTKYFPVSDVIALHELGCREFGESREQDARGKIDRFRAEIDDPTVRWHMIGRLQRNKARAVARWADTVHSVDSIRLADTLASGARAARDAGDRTAPIRVFLQISLDGDPDRGGANADDLEALADTVAAADGLMLAGLMGVPPLGWDPDPAFEKLHELAERFRRGHPDATELSAGMSGDLESAVRWGSTCVRVGTGLLGPRPLA